MKHLRSISTLGWLVGLALVVSGCLLISGTFVIVDTFEFTAHTGYYFYHVDLTSFKEWEDHKDKIDNIDAVGFDLWMTSQESGNVKFNVWLASGSATDSTRPPTATPIIEDYVVPPGTTHMTYAQSLTIIKNLATLKSLVKTGVFNYYAESDPQGASTFRVDSGKVIVTFSASN